MAFDHSRAALAVYDAGQLERDRAWDAVKTEAEFNAVNAAQKAAEDLVREAFFEDTKSFNSHSNCMEVGLDFVRRCASIPGDSPS